MRLIKVLFVLTLNVAANPVFSKPLNSLENFVDNIAEHIGLNGNVLVVQDGDTLLERSYGYQRLSTHEPINAHSQFPIASITKQFTAAAVLQLIDAKAFSLETFIGDVLPEFKQTPWAQGVQIKHLLNNTSGIYQYTSAETERWIKEEWDVYQSMTYLQDKPSASEPGSNYYYNNQGFLVLGYLVEQTTNQKLEDYFKENLFSVAGMKNTSLPRESNPVELIESNQYPELVFPHLYSGDSGKISEIEGVDFRVTYSAGAIISTVEDLARWNKALYSGKIISAKLLKYMLTPHSAGYGFGMVIDFLPNGKTLYWHNGGVDGYETILIYLESIDASIAVLSNTQYLFPSRLESLKVGLASMLLENNRLN